MQDLTIRHRLLDFGDSRVGDLGVLEVELLQTGESRQMYQPRVGDLTVALNSNNLAQWALERSAPHFGLNTEILSLQSLHPSFQSLFVRAATTEHYTQCC